MAKKDWGRLVLLFVGSFALGWLVHELRPETTKKEAVRKVPAGTRREGSKPPSQENPPKAPRNELEDLRRKIRAAERRRADLEQQIEELSLIHI